MDQNDSTLDEKNNENGLLIWKEPREVARITEMLFNDPNAVKDYAISGARSEAFVRGRVSRT